MKPDVLYYQIVAFLISEGIPTEFAEEADRPAFKVTCRAAVVSDAGAFTKVNVVGEGMKMLSKRKVIERFVLQYNRSGFERTVEIGDVFGLGGRDPVIQGAYDNALAWLRKKCRKMGRDKKIVTGPIAVTIKLADVEVTPAFTKDKEMYIW